GAGDQTTCRSLIYGSTSSTAASPSFDPLVAAVQSRLARSPRPMGVECPQCAGQRPHWQERWRAAAGHERVLATVRFERPSRSSRTIGGCSLPNSCRQCSLSCTSSAAANPQPELWPELPS